MGKTFKDNPKQILFRKQKRETIDRRRGKDKLIKFREGSRQDVKQVLQDIVNGKENRQIPNWY